MKGKNIISILLACSMLLAMAACGGDGGSIPAETSEIAEATSAGVSEPESTTLTLNLDGEPSNLDPNLMGGSTSASLMKDLCYGKLWNVESDDSIVLDMAESYEIDKESLTLTIKLRPDLKFADGSALTAEDVVSSIILSQNESGNNTSDVDFDRLTALDNTTIEVGLKQLSHILEMSFAGIGIVSKAWTEDGTNQEKLASNILCSGPYVLEPWTTGNDMVYNKNPHYWNADQVKYEKITVKCIADETTRFLDYSAGNVDICLVSDGTNLDKVENGEAPGTVCIVPMQAVNGLVFDTQNIDTFSNQNIRLALCHGADVSSLVEAYCGSRYAVATSPFPTSSRFYTEAKNDYDPELAKQYLEAYCKETGASGFEFTCTVQAGSVEANIAQALQYQYEQIGITMNIDAIDTPTFFDRQVQGTLYSSIAPITRGCYDPAKLLNSWRSISRNSIMHLANSELDAKLEDCVVNVEFTEEERMNAIYELQQSVIDYGKFLPMYEDISCWALNGSVDDMTNCVRGDSLLTPGLWLK